MTDYHFDQVIDRHHTFSTQWDYIADRFGRNDILPFSISDTDFAVPPVVQTALFDRLQHPIYGYTRWNHADFKTSIQHWFERDKSVTVDPEWVVYSPSVVFSIATLIRLHSEPNDSVAVFTPMYDAFYNVIASNDRLLIPIRLQAADEGYQLDWDSLATTLAAPQTKVLLLTNPHNPTGRLFSKAELQRLYQLCQQNHVFLISDDIHRDIIYGDNRYVPITEVAQNGVALCCSGSKTFNTPGLIGSYVMIPDQTLRDRFLVELKQKNALSSVSIMGMTAQIAAYNGGSDYVDQLVAYLDGNMQMIADFIDAELPMIQFTRPQSTYLAWMNVSALNLSSEALQKHLIDDGKVGIMPGKTYGDSRYLRMNIACPQVKLEEGLNRLAKGIQAAHV
ncbi:MalY/PatB family protein [Lacticaseibacillus saniviri]|uniref:cysteine-S-conjugate beta-lyase n=1 Tax=Lacticaseibacillus saniviri JCM 17471 = DSM 24301 TaxID=1293598 RepID=A0A0R2MUM2_9LACO|nr:PatB family C-S lyase [Lacticaseibacillus saniviri]KRO17113.1 cystathionine beta-lyase [Lacticaseibacillus saniviri JCM 17471 = DSM 24301]MCG4282194.1 PatB family C-S lyase [Lacticaseibacillus saniviri]